MKDNLRVERYDRCAICRGTRLWGEGTCPGCAGVGFVPAGSHGGADDDEIDEEAAGLALTGLVIAAEDLVARYDRLVGDVRAGARIEALEGEVQALREVLAAVAAAGLGPGGGA